MPVFLIPIYVKLSYDCEIEANSLEEAIAYYDEHEDELPVPPLTEMQECLSERWEDEWIREYNKAFSPDMIEDQDDDPPLCDECRTQEQD